MDRTMVAAAALTAAILAHPAKRWPYRTVRTVGTILALGTLVEPTTWGRRRRRPRVLVSIPLNLLSAAALLPGSRRPDRTRP